MIRIIDLYKEFNGNKVLNGLNLDINDGEIITIIGSSGCGKTVLLKLLVGLMKPDSGKIYVDGFDVTKLGSEKLFDMQKKFGFVFQSSALFDSLTVFENVSFGLRKTNKENLKMRVRKCLEHVGLAGIENLKPAQISGGMKKRIAIARAIAYNPKYLLYDEPTTGLDPITAETITTLILNIKKELRNTSIIVTHDLKCAYKVSDRIAMLHNGKIIENGPPDEIINTNNPITRIFLESSK